MAIAPVDDYTATSKERWLLLQASPDFHDPMKKLLLIVLLALVPLQVSWAAVTIYCQQEMGPAAEHLGHHEHQHEGSGSRVDGMPDTGATGIDLDCASCHAGHAKPMLPDELTLAKVPAPPFEWFIALFFPFPITDTPERPNWRTGSIAGEALSHI